MVTKDELKAWVDADLISAEQSHAIADFESSEEGTSSQLAGEALGYVGAGLSVIGLGFLFGPAFANLSQTGWFALTAMLSVALFVFGLIASKSPSRAMQRLASFLWGLSVLAVAATTANGCDLILTAVGEDTIALSTSVVATVYAAALWLSRPRPLALTLTHGGLAATLISLLVTVSQSSDPSASNVGVVFVLVGIVTMAGGLTEMAQPSRVAIALGDLTILLGIQIVAFDDDITGPMIVGLLVVIAMFVRSVRRGEGGRELIPAGLGLFVFLPELVFDVFSDTGAEAAGFLISGLSVIGAALVIGRVRKVAEEHAEADSADAHDKAGASDER